MWVRLCLLRINFVVNVLWKLSHWRGLLSSLGIQVFSFLFIFLINICTMSYEIANLGNYFSQIVHFISYSGWSMSFTYNYSLVYVWNVSCFYVFSAYPSSYNSKHTNKNYVFVVFETCQDFLNECNQCVL